MEAALKGVPRLAGPSEALKMMLTGVHVPAKKALDMGIVDGISEDVVNESIEFIKIKLTVMKNIQK